MSPEITATLFVSPGDIPLTLRLAAKVQPGRQDLRKSQPAALVRKGPRCVGSERFGLRGGKNFLWRNLFP